MLTDPGQARKLRLNPFAFPSNTDFFFALLIASVIGASLFIYNTLYFSDSNRNVSYRDNAAQCLRQYQASGFEIPKTISELADPKFAGPKFTDAQAAWQNCQAPFERNIAAWELSGVAILLVVAGTIYWLYPIWKIKRDHLTPFSAADDPEIASYLAELCREIGLPRQPIFVWDPCNTVSSGLAFGRLGRFYVALTGGLVMQFYTDRPSFRTILLHELAHHYNADVSKTYFTIAVWQAFVLTALLPFCVVLFNYTFTEFLTLLWRVFALAALVYLIRNAVLRAREFYADVRASVWDGSDALQRIIQAMPHKAARWRIALQVHPDPRDRSRTLEDTTALFQMGFGPAFAAGIATAVAFPNVTMLFSSVLTGTSQIGLAPFGAALLFAPLAVGVVGLGIWQATFASSARGTKPFGIGRAVLGLGLGIILGQDLSFIAALSVPTPSTQTIIDVVLGFLGNVFWNSILVIGLWFVLKWIAIGASAWLPVLPNIKHLHIIYTIGLIISGALLAAGLGTYFMNNELYQNTPFYFLLLSLSVPVAAIVNPLTTLGLFCVWAFPLATWFWRNKTTNPSVVDWRFLDSTSEPLALANQPPLRPVLAIIIGMIGGLVFCAFLLVLRALIRIGLPEAIRSTDDFILLFHFLGNIAPAVIMQVIVAGLATGAIKRLSGAHGLLAAFFAGCVMAPGILCLNLLFGGTVEVSFVWQVFALVVNGGGLVALPVVLFVSAIAHWIRDSRAQPIYGTA